MSELSRERTLSSMSLANMLTDFQNSFTMRLGSDYYKMKKSAQRDANTASALAVVRFGHRLPVPNTRRQDRLQYTAPQLASAQCKMIIKDHILNASLHYLMKP